MNEVVKESHLLNKGQNKIMEERLIKLSSKSIYPSLEKKLFAFTNHEKIKPSYIATAKLE